MLKEHITISGIKKILVGDLAGTYTCEVYLPNLKMSSLIYADNLDDVVSNTNNFVKIYLKKRIDFLENSKDIGRKEIEELEWTNQELLR